MAATAIIIEIVVAIVAAVISSYLALQGIEGAKASSGSVPEAKDGTVIRKIYGTVWIDDSQVLAYQDLPPEPIKQKVGKK